MKWCHCYSFNRMALAFNKPHRLICHKKETKPNLNIIIIILSCHQHGYPWPSLATPPYCSSLPAGLQSYTPYLHRVAVSRFELVALLRPCEGVHRSTSFMRSSLLLQLCLACLVRQILIVFVMGGRWPYSCCFVGCCPQDLFIVARSIFV